MEVGRGESRLLVFKPVFPPNCARPDAKANAPAVAEDVAAAIAAAADALSL
mgnify:CR=1 FL=1